MTTTVKLSRPIELRSAATGQVVSALEEVRLRPPTAGDMADALDEAGGSMKNTGSLIRHLVCRCAGLSRTDFDNLALEDGMALIGVMTGFLAGGPPTGPMPSPSSSGASGSRQDGDDGLPANSGSSLTVPLAGRPH